MCYHLNLKSLLFEAQKNIQHKEVKFILKNMRKWNYNTATTITTTHSLVS